MDWWTKKEQVASDELAGARGSIIIESPCRLTYASVYSPHCMREQHGGSCIGIRQKRHELHSRVSPGYPVHSRLTYV